MRIRSITAAIPVGMIFLVLLSGCGGDDLLQSSDAGKTTAFLPGTPNFDFEAVERYRGGTSGADLFFRIPWSSLVFVRDSNGFAARYELRVRCVPEVDSLGVRERSWEGFFRSDAPVNSRSTREQIAAHRMELPVGEFVAEAVLEDLQTGNTALRRQGISIFGGGDPCPRFLRITLEDFRRGSMEPFLPLHIPEGTDSLRAIVTLRNPGGAAGSGLHLFLLRYQTDSLPASPPYYLSPTVWSIRRTAVDFRKADTLFSRTLPLGDSLEQVASVSLAGLRPGYHEVVAQCSVRACGSLSKVTSIARSRGLTVVDATFPRMKTLKQMIEPLFYLATEREYSEIAGAKTEGEKRAKFEKFWLRLGETPERAANLIKQYYSRVEEANLYYSAYKEGWKTDMGMVYMIFGPPGTIGWGNRQEIWSYSSGYAFLFEHVNPMRANEPFENWVLVRDGSYEAAWAKEVDRWRRGQSF